VYAHNEAFWPNKVKTVPLGLFANFIESLFLVKFPVCASLYLLFNRTPIQYQYSPGKNPTSITMMLRIACLAVAFASTTRATFSQQIIRPITGDTTLDVHGGEGDDESSRQDTSLTLPQHCDLYMAPSTIPGAGLGIFTVSAKHRGDAIGYQLKDVTIPIDMESIIASSASNAAKDQAVHLLRNYTWTRNEYEEVLVLGVESLMNSHLAAANVKHYDSATVAVTDIPPGGEAWSYYGDHWFRARFSGDEEEIPGAEDYDRAESFVRDTYRNVLQGKDETSARRLWQTSITNVKDMRLLNALPSSYDEAKQIALNGMSIFHQQAQDDLPEDPKARCVDSIRIVNGKAYAARDFSAGSLITGSPLLHFVEGARYLPHQFLERCFGSSESSLILCPYGPGIAAMAHLYDKDDNADPNVKMKWTPEGQLHQKVGILESPVPDFLAYMEPVTSIDFYAVNDIKEGESLRLPTTSLPMAVDRAAKWNQSLSTLILRTESEQRSNPYPANLELQCHKSIRDGSAAAASDADDDLLWNESTIVPCQIKKRDVQNQSVVAYSVRAFLDGTWTRVTGVHRRYIRFVDVQFDTMDLSSIMPTAWKNINEPLLLERDEL
jgi:hypothetical protein